MVRKDRKNEKCILQVWTIELVPKTGAPIPCLALRPGGVGSARKGAQPGQYPVGRRLSGKLRVSGHSSLSFCAKNTLKYYLFRWLKVEVPSDFETDDPVV